MQGSTRPRGDHPRIRGVHHQVFLGVFLRVGSSPHTRGALLTGHGLSILVGIIPAYAGCTGPPCRGGARTWDHPRIRGVHCTTQKPAVSGVGSSPHTRGAPLGGGGERRGCRIIPAYAGCTVFSTMVMPSGRDHPRIRGVHLAKSHFLRSWGGSSPHTRGARTVMPWPLS